MISPSIRKSLLFAAVLSCLLPVSSVLARSGSALVDPVLENTPLPDYQYAPGGEDTPEAWLPVMDGQGFAGAKPGSTREARLRKQKVEEVLRKNPDMPDYMKKAYRAYQETGDRNIRRFAQAASEFQKQELREQLMQHIDDPEKLNRMMSALYGKPYVPYKAVGQSGYVLNQETGEILKGNDALSSAYRRKLAAQAAGKKTASSRRRESRRGRTYREDRDGGPSQNMKADYLAARQRAVDAHRPDLVEELDKAAVKNGFFD
ncbi:hypothetical protein [Oxalobacter paraformigenes]|uniref:Uncharacterized protein n=1 Tax=Oxalobacter paraformigenes TaxID=556268 RepID=C3X3I9_9BURK|nr:hypothetical protein [Oxalobacter paraformigenes]EEO27775.1 hypothetical protein OFAG_00928 [Oxalobacter paraformigenes]